MRQEEPPEINLDQILERIRSFTKRFRIGGGGNRLPWIVIAIFVVAAVGWLATGIYTVQPAEQAALRLFGDFDHTEEPGLHWFWPAPIGTRSVVAVEEVRRLEIGFRGEASVPSESLMITGDENIVDVQLLVQYDIKDIQSFLFRVADPEGIVLKSASESALRQVVGQRNIDDVLTVEKEAVQADTKLLLQSLLDGYQTGIHIREVKLQNVRPPIQVQDAFDDVVRAREDKQRIVNLAQAYQEDILPRARGDAQRVTLAAQAFKAEQINKATGEANRFLAILKEFRKSEEVTRQRLYLEAMEDILPGISKFVVATEGGSLLQFLPLTNVPTGLPVAPPAPIQEGQR